MTMFHEYTLFQKGILHVYIHMVLDFKIETLRHKKIIFQKIFFDIQLSHLIIQTNFYTFKYETFCMNFHTYSLKFHLYYSEHLGVYVWIVINAKRISINT